MIHRGRAAELRLLDWNEPNLFDDPLSGIANREIDKLLRQARRLAVCIVKGPPGIGINFAVPTLLPT